MTSESNGYATREQLLKPAERRFRDVSLPVAGHKLRIRSLTELEYQKYERVVYDDKGKTKNADEFRRRLIVACVVDHDGKRLFVDEDLPSLAQWDSADISAVQIACMEHCGFGRDDLEALARQKNSGGTIADSSP